MRDKQATMDNGQYEQQAGEAQGQEAGYGQQMAGAKASSGYGNSGKSSSPMMMMSKGNSGYGSSAGASSGYGQDQSNAGAYGQQMKKAKYEEPQVSQRFP